MGVRKQLLWNLSELSYLNLLGIPIFQICNGVEVHETLSQGNSPFFEHLLILESKFYYFEYLHNKHDKTSYLPVLPLFRVACNQKSDLSIGGYSFGKMWNYCRLKLKENGQLKKKILTC